MKPTNEELAIINGRLPQGATVTQNQVEVLPFMMFDSKETDRATIMTPEMMKKIVKDLNDGRVAMNSMHQSRSTLPAGRSVSGLFRTIDGVDQVLAKMYAVIQRPDGLVMDDGKDLADRYNTGAVFACSAGVNVGFYKCNICGNDIRDYKSCDHWPGELYQIDEKPVRCLAYMTGHDIQNGMAMDCGAYELSAVTAGGVMNAGILNETFGRYQDGANISEFKKTAFEAKELRDTVTFLPALNLQETKITEEFNMGLTADEVKKLIATEYSPLIEQKAALELANSEFKAKIDAFEVQVADYSAKVALLDAAAVTTAATIAEFTTQVAALIAEKTELDAFKTAFIAIVEAEGVKVEKTAEYATLSITALTELYEGYKADVAKLPSGAQGTGEGAESLVSDYAGLPDACFKVA